MKVLEVIATLGPGGAEALACDLSVALAKLGAEVKVLLLAGLRGDRGRLFQERLAAAGIEVVGAEPRKVTSIRNMVSVIKTLRGWRPDIVHCHMYNAEVPAMMGKLFTVGKHPLYVRTLHSTECVGYRSKSISYVLTKTFDYHVACADTVFRSYLDYTGRSADPRVVTISNGSTLAKRQTTSEEKHAARKKLMIADDSRVICQIGALRGETLARGVKAHDILLKAFARAFGGDPDVLLVCAGDGPLRGEAETLANGLGIASQTRFLGDIAEPWSLLHAADIFAMPSRFEGLSMALLEAISTGLPVVASDIPEIRAVCRGDGFLFCPVDNVAAFSDAFHTVLNDLSRYASAAEKGAVDARRSYSIDICAGRYWDEFNVMLERRSRQ